MLRVGSIALCILALGEIRKYRAIEHTVYRIAPALNLGAELFCNRDFYCQRQSKNVDLRQ